jgi:hypothetical protein
MCGKSLGEEHEYLCHLVDGCGTFRRVFNVVRVNCSRKIVIASFTVPEDRRSASAASSAGYKLSRHSEQQGT